MKKELTNTEANRFLQGLKLAGQLKGVKFAYAVAKNIRLVEPTHIALSEASREAVSPTERYAEFEKLKSELLVKNSVKDKNGNPVIEKTKQGDKYEIADSTKHNKEINELIAKYKDAFEAMEEKEDAFNELLEEKQEYEIQMLKLENVPEDITVEQMTGIELMIDG